MYGQIARTFLAILLACASVSACDGIFGKGCTLLACATELTVLVHGLEDVEYTVYASAPGEEVRSTTCRIGPSADTCTAYFAYFHPAEVTVRVVWADQEVIAQFAPIYATTFPNGPDCSPTCYEATVEVDVEQTGQPSNTRLELTR
jgi:hypothetical protein